MKMKNKCKRFLNWLLVFVMVLGLMPVTVLADTGATVTTIDVTNSENGETVDITKIGDERNFTFEAGEDGTYIMYYQIISGSKNFDVTTKASSSNAIDETEYRNPQAQKTGYLLDMKKGDTYTIKLLGNANGTCKVTAGVNKPFDGDSFNFNGFVFSPGTETPFSKGGPGKFDTNLSNKTLSLAFFMDSFFAYDKNTVWTASSSNADIVSFKETEVIEADGPNDYAEFIGYAPVFDLHKAGQADITITATYKGNVVSKTYLVTVTDNDTGTGDDSSSQNGIKFSTIAEIAHWIENCGSDSIILNYKDSDGTGKFVINESLKPVPDNIELNFGEQCDLIIPSGITFTTNGQFNCKNLTVDGTMNAYGGGNVFGDAVINGTMETKLVLNVSNNLNINAAGKLIIKSGHINAEYTGTYRGFERIEYASRQSSVYLEKNVKDISQLEKVLTEITNTGSFAGQDRVYYTLNALGGGPGGNSDFVFNKDITIPSKVELDMQGNRKFVVAENVTMTNEGTLVVKSAMLINGTVVNNGAVRVDNRPSDSRSNANGSISINLNGSFNSAANATLEVNTDSTITDIKSVLPWDNLNDYTIRTENRNPGRIVWKLIYTPKAIKLGTPTDLQWGIEYREVAWEYDRDTGKVIGVELEKLTRPGSMSWKTELPDQAFVQMRLYWAENDTLVGEWKTVYNPTYQPEYRSSDWFMVYSDDFESGDYYFTVQSIADGIGYTDSDVAKSDIYHYTKPSAKLDTCTDPTWEDRNFEFVNWAKWKSNSSSKYRDGDLVEFWFSDTEDGEYEPYNFSRNRGMKKKEMPFNDFFLLTEGVGYYKFRVRTLTSDIGKYNNSPWSELSPALHIKDISEAMSEELGDILDLANNQNLSDDEIRKAVQKMDSKKLRASLLTDLANDNVAKTLADIEAQVGGPAQVDVKPGASAFDANEISIVGANLNKKPNASDEPITLVLDKPEDEHVIPERFNSAVSVKFAMTLTDVKSPKLLEVPVKITLPVPQNINPEYLVIIHYHSDGERELVWPNVYEKDGKIYADFVLTSFSDFIIAEELLERGSQNEAEYEPYDNGVYEAVLEEKENLPEYVVSGKWTTVDGKWTFTDGTGETFKNRWAAVENPYADTKAGQSEFDWFFFDENGHMLTGWTLDSGRWYYLNPNSDGTLGRMFTGWQLIGGKWYYLNPISDGTRGAMMTDWQQIDGKWYYLDPKSGAMLADTWVGNYYVDASGAWDAAKTNER